MNYPSYDPTSAVTPLTAEELQALDLLLQNMDAEQAMSLDGMDGYLTALAIGPDALRELPTSDWLPAIWGGDPGGADDARPFSSKRQRKNTVVLALRHLRHLQQQLTAAPAVWEPIFSIAETDTNEYTDAREWCMGFLQAVDLLPEAWQGLWTAPAHAISLRPLILLGGGLDEVSLESGPDENIEDVAHCDRLSRAVPEAVLQLQAALRH